MKERPKSKGLQGTNILDELKNSRFPSLENNQNMNPLNDHPTDGNNNDREEEKNYREDENRHRLESPGKKYKRTTIPEALGETLVSEFIQNPLGDREFSSKSSSKTDLVNMINHPEVSPLTPNQQHYFDDYSQSSVDDDLKNSDLKALLKKRERQAHKPIRFNVMVVGESGLGKSTFIDAFLDTKYTNNQTIRPSTQNIVEREGTRIYNGIMLKMNFIDTPGYGPNLDVTEWYSIVKGYVIKQFENYKEEKQKRQRDKKLSLNTALEDKRVHALLYFIAGPRINQKDLIYMKRLKKYVNIIPILAKGDSYTVNEIKEMKLNLIKEAHDFKIEWFDFVEVRTKKTNLIFQALKDFPNKLKEVTDGKFGPSPPFLLISSLSKIKIAPNEYVFGREYTWGVCNIENPNHSDFTLLQTLLGGHICLEAIQLTHYFYKDYFKRIKEKKKNEEEDEKKRNIGVGALVAFGLFGALFAIKKKILNS